MKKCAKNLLSILVAVKRQVEDPTVPSFHKTTTTLNVGYRRH